MTELIGIVASILIILCYIPQVIKIYKTKTAEDISLEMYLILLVAIILWIISVIFKRLPQLNGRCVKGLGD